MARLKDLAVSTSDMFNFDPRVIKVEPGFNVRFDTPDLKAHIRGIADSIKVNGFLRTSPLAIAQIGEDIVLRDGHCRLAAVMLALEEGCEIKSVPCVTAPRHASVADQTLMLLTSNSGKALEILEKAEVAKRLISYGWDEKQVAAKAGVSVGQVYNWLTLAAAPVEVQGLVASGEVSGTVAIQAIRSEGVRGASEALKEAVAEAKKEGKRVSAKHVNGTRTTAQKVTEYESALRDILGIDNLQEAKSVAEKALRGM